jgi:hypothetical protein
MRLVDVRNEERERAISAFVVDDDILVDPAPSPPSPTCSTRWTAGGHAPSRVIPPDFHRGAPNASPSAATLMDSRWRPATLSLQATTVSSPVVTWTSRTSRAPVAIRSSRSRPGDGTGPLAP